MKQIVTSRVKLRKVAIILILRHEYPARKPMPSKHSNAPAHLRRPASLVCFSCLLLCLMCGAFDPVGAQSTGLTGPDEIRALVQELKTDARGPFQAIRWFCPDGSVLPPQSRCTTPGGLQHGLNKTSVERLRATHHLFLGQVLAGTEHEDFLDESHAFSRLRQYQIEQYLFRADDGWILRRARFYRGAFQAEDEEAWGRKFLEWMLQRSDLVKGRFFLMREAVRDIPHGDSDNLVQRVRSTSKEISDAYPAFLDIRVKIHGQPEASDTMRVSRFRSTHADRLSAALMTKIDALRADLRTLYASDPLKRLHDLARRLKVGSEVKALVDDLDGSTNPSAYLGKLAKIVVAARRDIEAIESGRERLRLMDLSLEAETLAFGMATAWRPVTVGQVVGKFNVLTDVAAGSGLLEWWEVDALGPRLITDSLSFDRFEGLAERAQRVVGWAIGMVSAAYEDEVGRYYAFEPLAGGFLDDRMRSSVLLALGETAGELASELSRRSGRESRMMNLTAQGAIRGLNPGTAVGQLIVHSGSPEEITFKPDAIYVLSRAPADLKPVAGIATVSEGNLVSHVQLLARNLGIPNAVVGPELLAELRPFSGQRVFYAVSPRGTVLMKPANDMTDDERRLMEKRKRAEERIRVPVDRVDLASNVLDDLHNLRASDSGRVCGPKAANLGQLSALFPERVAPGFIIPFGVFKSHMDQTIPGAQETYWERLRAIFGDAERARSEGVAEAKIEQTVLERLAGLRQEIERMPLKPGFVQSLKSRFVEIMGSGLGTVAVFVRSDTNMEDLKDFTGAGLNLTVPNVVSEVDVLQAVRRVWASPYRERGYQWRQKYLVNPEDVYPSLLILKSVNVDKSGVMITTGVSSGNDKAYTVAFNRGVGGAVDGQAAEMHDLAPTSIELLSPAREPEATTLPSSGGVKKTPVTFNERILTGENLLALKVIGASIRRLLPGTPGIETQGPFDIELGFLDNHIWLFQTRPFVENRSAGQSTYLSRMDIRSNNPGIVRMAERIPKTTP